MEDTPNLLGSSALSSEMADPITNGDAEEELVDYDEDEGGEEAKTTTKAGDQAKAGYVGIHSSGFKDFLLKPELLRAIVDCGFEHPSEGSRSLNTLFCCFRLQNHDMSVSLNFKLVVRSNCS